MEDRILEIVAELGRIEERKESLYAELEKLSSGPKVAARRRQLIAEILKLRPPERYLFKITPQESHFFRITPDEGRQEILALPTELPRAYNMLDQIRKFLASQPQQTFSATTIKTRLGIPASGVKSFYAALARLANTGQIRRVSKATYQAVPSREAHSG